MRISFSLLSKSNVNLMWMAEKPILTYLPCLASCCHRVSGCTLHLDTLTYYSEYLWINNTHITWFWHKCRTFYTQTLAMGIFPIINIFTCCWKLVLDCGAPSLAVLWLYAVICIVTLISDNTVEIVQIEPSYLEFLTNCQLDLLGGGTILGF